MKANELRLDNLVFNKRGDVDTVIEINDYIIETENKQQYIDECKPIPLNKELLVNLFGFTLIVNEGLDWYHYSIDSEVPSKHITVRTDDGDNFFAVFNHSPCDMSSLQFISYCQYVHQLQNLYFALTGEELEIKE